MRHRVAVEADYEFRQPGTLRVPEEPAYFFCEIPAVWAAEGDKLSERLLAVGIADLQDLCAGINAWQRANQPTAPDVDIRLRSVRVTLLTLAETEAMPWLFQAHPLRYPCRCLIVAAEDAFTVSERDDFGRRAQEDLPALRALLPPMTPLPTDELLSHDLFGHAFWFYGDRFVTRKNENRPGTDYDGFDTYIYRFSLYRLSDQKLVLKIEHGLWNQYAADNRLDAEYILSRDNGGVWDADPGFDAALLTDRRPVWAGE